jgi:hypothetical protein
VLIIAPWRSWEIETQLLGQRWIYGKVKFASEPGRTEISVVIVPDPSKQVKLIFTLTLDPAEHCSEQDLMGR